MSLKIDKNRAALLIADFQIENVASCPSSIEGVLRRAASVLDCARKIQIPIVHIKMSFRHGWPEVLPHLRHRYEGRFLEGSEGAEFHPAVAPKPGETIVAKRRTGPFSSTDLNSILHAAGADTLLISGIVTSGVVLSTVRWAADIDYEIVVISDACLDRDPEVHHMLLEKVLPRQATIATTSEVVSVLLDAK